MTLQKKKPHVLCSILNIYVLRSISKCNMENVNAKMFEYVQQYGKIVSFFKIQGSNIIIGLLGYIKMIIE